MKVISVTIVVVEFEISVENRIDGLIGKLTDRLISRNIDRPGIDSPTDG